MGTIGPTLPPEFTSKRKRSEDASHSSSPPAKRSRSASPSSPPPSKSSRLIGPSLPPAQPSEVSATDPATQAADDDNDASSSSDSDIGPALPGAVPSSHIAEPPPPADRASTATTEPSKPQREEWMLAPPSSADWTSRIDPTKMKNRRFQSGKSATSKPRAGGTSGEIDTLWTETPEQKRQRLADEVLGKRGLATKGEEDGGGRDEGERRDKEARRKREQEERRETERQVREYNEERGRGGSLMDSHQRKKERREGKRDRGEKGKDEEDDPSKRAFDREKDMGLGQKIGYKARSDMTKSAKDFGGRFGAGGFL